MAGHASLSPDTSSTVEIPPLVTDATWSLRTWPVEVTFSGLTFSIPALPAADWLAILMSDQVDLEEILPGLAGVEEADALEEALVQGKASLQDLYRMALETLSLVSGRPWYVAMKIISVAAMSWSALGGEFVIRNVDADRISLAAWLDAAYLIMLRNMKSDDINIFNAKLLVPPPGVENPEEEDILPTPESFMAMGL